MPIKKVIVALLGLFAAAAAQERTPEQIRDAELAARANYDETKVAPYTLPDPLVCQDGTAVRDAATWMGKRRKEILESFSRCVYGRTPSGRPDGMRWAVTSTDETALGGTAVRKAVTLWFSTDPAGPQMHLLIYEPARIVRRPLPAFIGLNFYGNQTVSSEPGIALPTGWISDSGGGIVHHRATEASRGSEASRWPLDLILEHGYAVATVYYGDLCPDHEGGLDEGIAPLFGRPGAPRRDDQWGAIGEWAWGLSRGMDYLAADPDIDARRVAVFGLSRLGKAALWAAAQDQRFVLAISSESGSMGAKLGRRNFSQTPTNIATSYPGWFCPAFQRYRGHDDRLPVDQHELLALIAPRPLYVASTSSIHGDPLGEFLGMKNAEPVYALFHLPGLPSATKPPVNAPIWSAALGYHVRTGSHDITRYDWSQYLAFADLREKAIRPLSLP